MIYIRENAFENVCGRHTGRDDKTDEDNLPLVIITMTS